jgi:hypothetical protein
MTHGSGIDSSCASLLPISRVARRTRFACVYRTSGGNRSVNRCTDSFSRSVAHSIRRQALASPSRGRRAREKYSHTYSAISS